MSNLAQTSTSAHTLICRPAETESLQVERKVKKSIQIRRKNPQLSRSEGYDISPVFLPNLAGGHHDPRDN